MRVRVPEQVREALLRPEPLLDGEPRRFWFRDASELFAIEDIFGAGEYDVVADADPRVIVDLGANAGQAAR